MWIARPGREPRSVAANLNQKPELELQFVLWSQRTVVADSHFRCSGVIVLTKPLDVQASIFGACLKPG